MSISIVAVLNWFLSVIFLFMLTEVLKNLNDIPVLYSFAYHEQPRINLLSLAISGVLEKKK